MTLREWARRVCETTACGKYEYEYYHDRKNDRTVFRCWCRDEKDNEGLFKLWGFHK